MTATALESKGYSVKEQSYKRNETFNQTVQKVTLTPQIALTIENKVKEDSLLVNLGVKVGSLTDAPFEVNVQVCGEFVYHHEKDTARVGVDTLIRRNAVAILYPYVRSLVSNLTNTSNEYPACILPTIDVAQVLKEQPGASELAD